MTDDENDKYENHDAIVKELTEYEPMVLILSNSKGRIFAGVTNLVGDKPKAFFHATRGDKVEFVRRFDTLKKALAHIGVKP